MIDYFSLGIIIYAIVLLAGAGIVTLVLNTDW